MAINKVLLTIIRLESLPFLFHYFIDSTRNKVDINFAINRIVTIHWKDKNGQRFLCYALIRPRVVDSSFIVTRSHQKIKSYFAALILIILNVVTTPKNINKICTKLKIIVCGLSDRSSTS